MKFLVSGFHGLSLDRPEATGNGKAVHAWRSHGRLNQAWYYSRGVIRSAEDPDFCLDVEGGKYVNGGRVHLWKYHGGKNQKWVFDNGVIRSYGNPEFCLDIDAGCQGKNGGRIQLYQYLEGKYNGGRNQSWEMLTESQLAKRMGAKGRRQSPEARAPRGKRQVLRAEAHIQLTWWHPKDSNLDPGGKQQTSCEVRILRTDLSQYSRLTKTLVKDAMVSALSEYQGAESTELNGWSLEWVEIGMMSGYGWYDSTRGVRVRVLSIEELGQTTLSV